MTQVDMIREIAAQLEIIATERGFALALPIDYYLLQYSTQLEMLADGYDTLIDYSEEDMA